MQEQEIKTIKARIVNKHNTEKNWLEAGEAGFTPKQGELIVYDIEIDQDGNILELPEGRTEPYLYERTKIGDGITKVHELPFSTLEIKNGEGKGAIAQGYNTRATGDYAFAEGNTTIALSGASHAEGVNNIVGAKGYYIIAMCYPDGIPTSDTDVKSVYLYVDTQQIADIGYNDNGTIQDDTAYVRDLDVNYKPDTMLAFVVGSKYYPKCVVQSVNKNKLICLLTGPIGFNKDNFPTSGLGQDDNAIHAVDIHNLHPSSQRVNSDSILEGEVVVKGFYAHAEGRQNNAIGIGSHVEGRQNDAYGDYSHAEGRYTKANYASHAEGIGTHAKGMYAHSEGYYTKSYADRSHTEGWDAETHGLASHAEGYNTRANGDYSHAEGNHTEANGSNSHTEGIRTKANGSNSHAEGQDCEALSENSHAEGAGTIATGNNSHAEGGLSKTFADNSHAEGWGSEAHGNASHAEGYYTKANGNFSHAEGNRTTADGADAHAEGFETQATKDNSHAEGLYAIASGFGAHSEGCGSLADGDFAHAQGYYTKAHGINSHAEGHDSTTNNRNAHAEGLNTRANGENSHAEGDNTFAYGNNAHAEGQYSKAFGENSHAEGDTNAVGKYAHSEGKGYTGYYEEAQVTDGAIGDYSHTEGFYTASYGKSSHAEGDHTIAKSDYQHVQGKYNVVDAEQKYAHIVGNGDDADNRSNAYTLDWEGNAWFAGRVSASDPKEDSDVVNFKYFSERIDNKVGKTDYASKNEAGVVKIDPIYGFQVDQNNGVIATVYADESTIAEKSAKYRPITPFNLDYAVKAALSDCRITWTDDERFAALKLLGVMDSSFRTIQSNEGMITIPSATNRYAQISEIHGMDSMYFAYTGGIFKPVKNYPPRLVNDQGAVLFELPSDVLTRLTDFGYRGNYIYFDNGKAFYHQANRAYDPYANGGDGSGYYNPPLEEGEEVIHRIDYTMLIIKLAAPIVTDISDYITADGIIDLGDAEYITAAPLVNEEEVRALSPFDYCNYYFPTVKILVETYGGSL